MCSEADLHGGPLKRTFNTSMLSSSKFWLSQRTQLMQGSLVTHGADEKLLTRHRLLLVCCPAGFFVVLPPDASCSSCSLGKHTTRGLLAPDAKHNQEDLSVPNTISTRRLVSAKHNPNAISPATMLPEAAADNCATAAAADELQQPTQQLPTDHQPMT